MIRRVNLLLTRRELLRVGAAGAAGLAASQVRANSQRQPSAPKPSFRGKIVLFGAKHPQQDSSLIQTIRPDGSGLETISDFSEESVFAGRVSPDGDQVAFSIYGQDRRFDLWIMHADGTGGVLVDDAHVACWSHDGKRVAFFRGENGNWKNYTVHIETKVVEALALPRTDAVWDWSRDGSEVISISHREGNSFQDSDLGSWSLRQVYRTKLDGSDPVRLSDPDLDNIWPRLSPDGRKVAFEYRTVENNQIQLYGAVLDRTSNKVIPIIKFKSLGVYPNGMPCWSPDGSRLAWMCYARSAAGVPRDFHIILLDADGSGSSRLDPQEGRWCGRPDWA